MSRGTRAVLRLDALRNNLQVIRGYASGSRVFAVVKANAYGHGIELVVRALAAAAPAGVDGFAVATLDEARRIRRCGVERPVLLLEGITAAAELNVVQELGLQLVVHSAFQIDDLEQCAPPSAPLKLWLKVDTGMHRLGFSAPQAEAALARLKALPGIDPDIVLMSHLANADDRSDAMTKRQTERLISVARQLGIDNCSLANSAGIIAWPQTHQRVVRAGLMLYGISPCPEQGGEQLGLTPCMTLKSTLMARSDCHSNDAIGYGGIWRCPEPMPVGVVAIGYGDGYPRQACNGTPVLIDGVRCPLVGRVSMDMLTVDLRPLPAARIGAEVVLWGDGLPVEEVARHAGMIPYELICGVTARVESSCLDPGSDAVGIP